MWWQNADTVGINPFGILTFIVAPVILTNASSVMALGTSNGFARAITGFLITEHSFQQLAFGKSWPPQNRRILRAEKRSKQRRKLNEKRDEKSRLLLYVSDDKKSVRPKRKLLQKSNCERSRFEDESVNADAPQLVVSLLAADVRS